MLFKPVSVTTSILIYLCEKYWFIVLFIMSLIMVTMIMLASKNRWTIFILKQFEKAWYFFLKCLIKFTSDNICAQIVFITKFLNVLSTYLTDTELFGFYISSWSSLHNMFFPRICSFSPTLVIKFIGITLSIIFSCYPFWCI